MNGPRIPLALAIGVALIVSGCPPRPCPTHPFRDPASALTHYQDMRRPALVLRAAANVDRRGGSEGRIHGQVLMFIQRPDHVRFDAMAQMFGAAAILTSDGQRFALMDLRDNRFLQGPTCPANIERLLGIRFGGPEVTRLLLGETPHIEATRRTISCSDGTYRITLHGANGRRQELDLEVRASDIAAQPDDQRMRLRRSEVFGRNGQTEWRVTYGDYRFVENPTDTHRPRRGIVMPYTVRFEEPRRGIDTLVRFEDVDLNVSVPPSTFQQSPRRGLRIEEVSCD